MISQGINLTALELSILSQINSKAAETQQLVSTKSTEVKNLVQTETDNIDTEIAGVKTVNGDVVTEVQAINGHTTTELKKISAMPVGALLPFYSGAKKIVAGNSEWLRSGVIETDVAQYPAALAGINIKTHSPLIPWPSGAGGEAQMWSGSFYYIAGNNTRKIKRFYSNGAYAGEIDGGSKTNFTRGLATDGAYYYIQQISGGRAYITKRHLSNNSIAKESGGYSNPRGYANSLSYYGGFLWMICKNNKVLKIDKDTLKVAGEIQLENSVNASVLARLAFENGNAYAVFSSYGDVIHEYKLNADLTEFTVTGAYCTGGQLTGYDSVRNMMFYFGSDGYQKITFDRFVGMYDEKKDADSGQTLYVRVK